MKTIAIIIILVFTYIYLKIKRIMRPMTLIKGIQEINTQEIPEEIDYLKPLLNFLNNIPAENLDESNEEASEKVNQILMKRLEGYSLKEAKKLFEGDFKLFAGWSMSPSCQEISKDYLFGYFSGLIAYNGIKEIIKETT